MKNITIRDSGNKEVLEAYFLNHEGQPYNLENKTVTFMENKDGDKFVSDPNVQIVNATAGFVRYTLQSQVHSAPGIAWFEINDDSGLVDSTGNFNIRVENGLRATADNTTYIAALEKLKQQMEALIRQADGELKTELQRAEQQLNQGVQNFRPQYNSLSNAINQNTTDIGLNSLEIKRNSVDIQNLEGAGHLMDILLVDGLGNHITDDYGNRIGGYKWLPLTDVTLTQAGLPADGQAVGEAIKTELQRAEQQLNNQNTTDIGLNSLEIKRNSVDIQNLEGAGHLTDIVITDQLGNHITDEYGNRIGGYKWLPLTDVTLTQAGLPADGQTVGNAIRNATTFKPEDYGIQVLYLWGGNITSLKDKSVTLTNEVTYKFPHYHIQGTLNKFKVQGASSVYLPKKNYTLNFDQSFEAFGGMGKQHKYVIKANYKDATQSLNNVGAKLWGKIRGTHLQLDGAIQNSSGDYLVDDNGNHIIGVTDPQLSIGGHYGAVNGFPIAVYINDQYWGLYSFNIPKDDWMAKMPKSGKYAIVDAVWKDQGAFNAETTFKDNMELQFCSTKDNTWAKDSINELIRAAKGHYDNAQALDAALTPLVDYDSVYDYYIYSVLTGNVDGVYRNYLLQTFDGKKWYFVAYDMDESFGKTPQDTNYLSAYSIGGDDFWHEETTFENIANNNRLFYQFWKFHKDEVLKRTKDLISGVMSAPSVDSTFINYSQSIPRIALIAENKVWKNTPDTSVNTIDRIGRWYHDRIDWVKNNYLEKQ